MQRPFTLSIGITAFFLPATICFGVLGAAFAAEESDIVRAYIGTYTNGASEGVYVLDLDRTDGTLKNVRLAGEAENPSFVAFHPTKPLLYAVGEMGRFNDSPGGAVFAFRIDDETGKLEAINAESSMAGAPCHVTVGGDGRFVLAANYSGGNVISLPIRDDGGVEPVACLKQHEGSGPNAGRQKSAHAHCVNMDPTGQLLLVCDLGVDKVYVYRLDKKTGELTEQTTIPMAPGAGPRHLAWHPNDQWLYVINELDSTITALKYDAEHGAFNPLQTIGTLPSDFDGQNTTAEVLVHPTGCFVYGSNRGHNSIAVFAVAQETGKLTFVERESCGGDWPRCIGIDPSGEFLLAANQKSNNVVAYRIDQETGELTPTGGEATVDAPVCVVFREVE